MTPRTRRLHLVACALIALEALHGLWWAPMRRFDERKIAEAVELAAVVEAGRQQGNDAALQLAAKRLQPAMTVYCRRSTQRWYLIWLSIAGDDLDSASREFEFRDLVERHRRIEVPPCIRARAESLMQGRSPAS